MIQFTHLHVHSHYSILDGMSKVPDLIDKCMRNGMHAMALTDHGNMFGIKEFLDYSEKVNNAPKKKVKECEEEIAKTADANKLAALNTQLAELRQKAADFVPFKPIVGIEAYCAHENLDEETLPGHQKSRGWHLILLAKNKQGYHNLCKLSSLAFTEGYYYNARIDHKALEKYHEGIICSSACLGGEVPQKIMKNDLAGAEESVKWFKKLFGDDYYLELQRHKTDKPNAATDTYEKQQEVNAELVKIARKYDIKLIATNDVHFVEEEHGEAHDRLICLSTQKDFDDPNRLHYTKQEWLKSPEEMAEIFGDLPEALANTQEIADKVEVYSINSAPIMPKFPIPETFGTEEEYRKKFTEQNLFDEFTRNEKGEIVLSQEDAEKKITKLGGYDKLYRIKLEADYLAKLTWDGAQQRYGDNLSDEQRERIIFELHIMKTMGFPGYFLIVQDYIRAAREELGVSVGPGRGSAAGSVVAYCLKITDIDPLKYDLLFERFLNPDRISLPDIDVDFDDDGRGKVLDWVTKKYGHEKVAHIITYGTMASKSSIADVGRVQKVPLSTVNTIKGLIPDRNFPDSIKDEKGKSPKVNLKNCYKYLPEFQEYLYGADKNISTMLTYAEELEDTNRQVGIHACGVIIGADDLTNYAPICTVEDRVSEERVVVTQYDGHVIESVGLIKMDFLGLKTLSLIKEAIANIKKSKNIDIDIDNIPLDDELTYKLFCDGQTIGVFQFESAGMQKYLRELQPSKIEDLIAMNALYRPGPMDYIPQFIRRKHGDEPIVYDIPVMEKYLKDTYGVTVYQEQVMLLSRLLANFTRGEADTLRKAMGKKIAAMLAMLKPKFIEGGKKNGHDQKILEKIWCDWEKFASYAFNKSHAACYAWVAYQTAYLKAHYPAEYMAANLTRNKDSITEVSKFMDECKSMKLIVKGPDINESELNFTVNKQGVIRFGLGGIKGVGEGAVEAIVNERNAHGAYKSIYDFVERINLTACNRKAIESMALAGCFDTFGDTIREQMLAPTLKNDTFIEQLITYGNRYQNDQNMNHNSLFGNMDGIEIAKPTAPKVAAASILDKLNKEKEVVGIYISAHPLDRYQVAIKYGCSQQTSDLDNLIQEKKNTNFTVGGMVVNIREGRTKKDTPFGILTIEDYAGQYEFPLFGQDYVNYGKFLKKDLFLLINGCSQQRGIDWKWKKNDTETPQTWEIKIKSIDLLEEKADTLIRNIYIDIPLSNITQPLIADLMSLSNGVQPRVELGFNVYDEAHNYKTSFKANKIRINADKDLFKLLETWKNEQVINDFHINR
ncbi:MAG: DNA polymerase III subunit alpha [Paludibacteraceae bacterium]